MYYDGTRLCAMHFTTKYSSTRKDVQWLLFKTKLYSILVIACLGCNINQHYNEKL